MKIIFKFIKTKMKMNITFYVCLMLTIIGLLFSTIAYRSWRSTNNIIEKGVSTEGVVMDIASRVDRKKGTTTYAPTVQFRTQKGEVVTYPSNTFTNPCSYVQGQYVPIWYMPENPQEATMKGADAYFLPLIFAGFGALALLFGLPTILKFLISLMYQ
jgi:hypothetical protein